MSKKLVIGNWKMNPESFAVAKAIAQKTREISMKLKNTEVVVCPPFSFIPACVSRNQPAAFHLGAQSVSFEESGPHTGEVGIKMLANLGVEYIITGHSEERAAGDTDEMVSKRIFRIVEGGLTAVVCVGEKNRDDDGVHLEFLRKQIKGTFANIPEDKAKRIILAYEPIWAIGAKEAMLPEQVYEMSLFVKKIFADVFGHEAGHKVRVLYGGSVNFRNAGDIIKVGKVDGLLVGRESVNMPGFKELLKAVDAIE
ncbi:MAG: triose-phosphate isomerase [Candidatus Taylorbacteria bacterium]|nr:triose-phosphate isomerase [Candidatus Taylorbacteria bacterium]